MKAFLALLLSASTVLARPFGDDNPSGKWLPVPDAFKWPHLAEQAPAFKPEWKNFSNLPEAQRVAIVRHWPDDKNPDRVQLAEADLNNDGQPELFLGIPGNSGTGGTYYEILSRTKGEPYVSIGSFQGWGIQFLIRKNGYYQIGGISSIGGGQYRRYLIGFASEGYVLTRNEYHDFNSGKVTIPEIREGKPGEDGAAAEGLEREVRTLVEDLTHESPSKRSSAAQDFSKIGKAAVPTLLEMLSEKSAARAESAVAALKIAMDAKGDIPGWIIFLREQQHALPTLAARRLSKYGMGLP